MTTVADSLEIDDPELIKFMNTKMTKKSDTISDLITDLINYYIDNIFIVPCEYIYNYISTFIEYQLNPSTFLEQDNVPNISQEEPVLESPADSDSDSDSEHVIVENNNK